MTVLDFDHVIIREVRKGNSVYENLVFERFRGIEKFNNEAEDIQFSIYVDTISDVIMQIRNNKNLEIENLRAYVKRVFGNKFRRYLKLKIEDRERYKSLDARMIESIEGNAHPESLLDVNTEQRIQDAVNQILDQVSDRCKEIFNARFVKGLRFKELAECLDFSSENSAKNANHDCLKQARIKGKSIIDNYYYEEG